MILSRFAALFVSLTQKVSLFQNHDGRAASSVAFDAGMAELVLTTHDAWVAREEVFINYGNFSPSEFLTGSFGECSLKLAGLSDWVGARVRGPCVGCVYG